MEIYSDNNHKEDHEHEEFKITDDEKISIIQQLLEQLQPQYPLQISKGEDKIGSNSSSTYILYNTMGNKLNKRSNNNNLATRIEEFTKESKNQQDKEPQQQGKNYRYFRDNMRCFRCRRPGHYKSVCPQQFSCIYCLSYNHNYEKCPQKIVCYRCYNFGHVVNQCPRPTEGPYCATCKRKHFDNCYFLTKGIQQVKQMFNTDILYNSQQIRCMVCLRYGHVTCYGQKYEGLQLQQKKQ